MLERPLAIAPDHPVTLRAIADGTCLVVYANEQVALSCRMYDHRMGKLGLFVTEGKASFRNSCIKTMADVTVMPQEITAYAMATEWSSSPFERGNGKDICFTDCWIKVSVVKSKVSVRLSFQSSGKIKRLCV